MRETKNVLIALKVPADSAGIRAVDISFKNGEGILDVDHRIIEPSQSDPSLRSDYQTPYNAVVAALELVESGRVYLAAENLRVIEIFLRSQLTAPVPTEPVQAEQKDLPAANSIRDGLTELVSYARTINRSRHQLIKVKDDDQPCYWQREEWIDGLLEICDTAQAALASRATE